MFLAANKIFANNEGMKALFNSVFVSIVKSCSLFVALFSINCNFCIAFQILHLYLNIHLSESPVAITTENS